MAAKTDFDKFLERQSSLASGRPRVDWQRRRDEWLSRLDQFYDTVEDYLSDYVKAKKIITQKIDFELNEENIGRYTVRKMIINVGVHELVLNPVGTLIIGARGRIDLDGPAATIRFVLVDKNAISQHDRIKISVFQEGNVPSVEHETSVKPMKSIWKISTRPPSLSLIELNKQSFLAAIMEVTNG